MPVIRHARESDAAIIAEIYNHAIEDRLFATCDVKPVTAESRLPWLASHKDPFPAFVMEDEANNVVGWSALNHFSVRPIYPAIAELSVYVHRNCRNKFIGGRLFLHTIGVAKELGFQSLVSLTLEKNKPSIRGLMAVGFRKALTLKEVAMLHGERVDVAWLQKDLRGDWASELSGYMKRLGKSQVSPILGSEDVIMNNHHAPFEEAYICYKRVIDEIAVEAQASCEKAHRSYAAAVRDACGSETGAQLVETAFRNYMKALLEAWAAEETQQRTEKAHQDYLLALQSSNAPNIEEKRYRYERALEEAVSPEVAARCLGPYRDYVQTLKTARKAIQF